MGGVSAVVSKTAAAPIERVKLLIQNQDDGYWAWFAGNLASGGAAGASYLLFVYSLDYARTSLVNDATSATKDGGESDRQCNGLLTVYRKPYASDGIGGLKQGFTISCVGMIVYRGLSFGLYDSLKPVVLIGTLQDGFLASFLLGWRTTAGVGASVLASYICRQLIFHWSDLWVWQWLTHMQDSGNARSCGKEKAAVCMSGVIVCLTMVAIFAYVASFSVGFGLVSYYFIKSAMVLLRRWSTAVELSVLVLLRRWSTAVEMSVFVNRALSVVDIKAMKSYIASAA